MKKTILLGLIAAVGFSGAAAADTLRMAVDGDHRTAAYKERDVHRRPYETLQFFGINPEMTVVELWPGGGWYSEILAPYLKPNGKLYAAHFDPQSSVSYFQKSRVRFDEKMANLAWDRTLEFFGENLRG